ncbi:hypothetical protein M422DRAFT_30466 [Sphaerobolus stellatus SS14]|uniref:Mitochondrial import inner membrane translocase subunit TIM54 n=1 Tax=Sphaerobolus stellatus (strain SS14) TaxID=990650 RepID=A0A0C9W091_SPHS4|nr:hypothetical protein M422DRAFT_30466 [Sphaerobolus stellatus SS14]
MNSASPPESKVPPWLRYTGIPPAVFNWRPKVPSRNWLIFWSISGSLVGLYAYDRRRCRQIREEYIEKVRQLAEEPMDSSALPRKVTVYGARWPGDDDWERGLKYFRKYVKPILVAAAVDYQMVGGKRHGEIAEKVCAEVKKKRRIELGLEAPPAILPLNIPGQSPQEKRKRELEGAIVIIGRQTFKEFMDGLKRGWTEPPFKVDKEDLLAQELQSDGVFDEIELEGSEPKEAKPTTPPFTPSLPGGQPFGSPFPSPLNTAQGQQPSKDQPLQDDRRLTTPPSSIPVYPPLLLVRFTNLVGLRLVPGMIWEFFHRREDVKNGAEAAYRLITAQPRPIRGPTTFFEDLPDKVETSPSSDLSFDLKAESYYKSSLSIPSDVEKGRNSYYEALRPKIVIARELARSEREPTKDEINYPPPTEVELRAERMKKELRWRGDLAGWEIVKPDAPVAWDPRFEGALSVYPTPEEDSTPKEFS